MRFDLHRSPLSGEVMAEAGPWPILRPYDQASADWVAVHILELLDRFVVVSNIEVIVAALPESDVSRPFEFSRHLLFQHLQDDEESEIARFAAPKMHVLGHDSISGDNEAVALPHFLQLSFKDAAPGSRFEKRQSSITTEGYKVEVSRMLIAD